ncbi:MAG: 3-isopropylmalate dehydratase small subunit [Marinicaulis sp.]|nr:3-isopropylmalate dehydratase small subunit [Marinicaulis sp.]
MPLKPIQKLTSRTIVLPEDNIDTDQIIPARFLTTTKRSGLGRAAFYDWRYDDAGSLRNQSPLNLVSQGGYSILVAGRNFGCGSSREHAPWALLDLGVKAVISCDIADIFKSNALKNELLPIVVDDKTHRRLLKSPGIEVTIDLESQTVRFRGVGEGDWNAVFEVDSFSRQCLLEGIDPLGFIMKQMPTILEFEERRR